MSSLRLALVALAACHGANHGGTVLALRPACSDAQFWDGAACRPLGDGVAKLAAGKQALGELKVDEAKQALDAAEQSGPLAHDTIVQLWEQRGIAAAYVDDEAGARTAFDMLLALDPAHFLSYTLSPKATFVFEKVRDERRDAPELELNWPRGQRVGDPVPLDVGVIADPKLFLNHATLFVRTRGDAAWRAADVALGPIGAERRVVLPPVAADKPVSLEVYLRAYDPKGNEVFDWADAQRPREIALRYDPPPPWYKRPAFVVPAIAVLVIGTALTVYALELKPPDKIGGGAMVTGP